MGGRQRRVPFSCADGFVWVTLMNQCVFPVINTDSNGNMTVLGQPLTPNLIPTQ